MWLAATIFAAILSVTGVALAEELVGKVVPPFPGGMYQGGGQCIGPNAKDRAKWTLVYLPLWRVGRLEFTLPEVLAMTRSEGHSGP
jgi:hypothetical protein